ncbi:MAG: ZapG family protein [Gammaproteobacteria bacterium]
MDLEWIWGISIIAFALGLAGGFLVAYRVIPSRSRIQALEQALAAAQAEQQTYRDQVNQHFQKTAELFEDMTGRYRAVYQHLARGAQSLCEQQPAALQLDPAAQARTSGPDAAQAADPAPEAETPAAAPVEAPEPSPDAQAADDEQSLGDAPHIPELTEAITPAERDEPPEPVRTDPGR